MNTNQLTELVDVLHKLWETHVPVEHQVPVLPVAIGMLILGTGLSVLGAKLARLGIIGGFVGTGVLIALAATPAIGLPMIAMVLLGALIVGGIGHVLFRLWVGLAMAAFFAVAAVGTYGSQTVVPHLLTYQSAHDFEGEFTLPVGSRQSAQCTRSTSVERSGTGVTVSSHAACYTSTAQDVLSDVRAWADDFWLYVSEREVDVNRRILGIGLGAALIGLLLGAVLPRFTLIAVTAVMGTGLVMSGLAGLASYFQVDVPLATGQHGRPLAVAGIVFLFASVLLQTMLTRKAPAGPRPQPAQ